MKIPEQADTSNATSRHQFLITYSFNLTFYTSGSYEAVAEVNLKFVPIEYQNILKYEICFALLKG